MVYDVTLYEGGKQSEVIHDLTQMEMRGVCSALGRLNRSVDVLEHAVRQPAPPEQTVYDVTLYVDGKQCGFIPYLTKVKMDAVRSAFGRLDCSVHVLEHTVRQAAPPDKFGDLGDLGGIFDSVFRGFGTRDRQSTDNPETKEFGGHGTRFDSVPD